MATAKVKKITDERILSAARYTLGEGAQGKLWTPACQCYLVWRLLRTNPKLKFQQMKPEELEAAWKQWEADWNNGRLAYPSNTARSLAESGVCKAPTEASEFDAEEKEL